MKKLFKTLLCATALFVAVPMSSCSSFFGSEEVVITSFTTETDDYGNTIVKVEFGDGSDPLTLTIPSSKSGVGIASIVKSTDNGDTIYTINYVDDLEPTVIKVPASTGVVTAISSLENEDGSLSVRIELKEGDPISFIVPSEASYASIKDVSVVENETGTVITISYTAGTLEDTVITIPKIKGIESITSVETSDRYTLTFRYSDGTSEVIAFSKPSTPNTWLSGNGVPTSDLGIMGDFYYDRNTSTIYQKTNLFNWDIIAVLKTEDTTYTVTFNANGGMFTSSSSASIQTVKKGDTFYNSQNSNSFPSVFYLNEDDTQKTFLGWYTSQDKNDVNATHFTDLTPVMCDITLYAWWE